MMSVILNSSCAGSTISCNGCMPSVSPGDATRVPRSSFVYIESDLYANDASCTENCELKVNTSYASGFFIYRSKSDTSTGFVMTADHLCQHRDSTIEGMKNVKHAFVVYDYFGKKHDASHYFSSANVDVCVLIITDMSDDATVAELADTLPMIGSRAYSVSAPKGYFVPNAALIFEGLYSGNAGPKTFWTIPTEPGSSGAPIFDASGYVVSMIIGVPVVRLKGPTGDVTSVRITPSLCIAESLDALKTTLNSIESMDQVFGLSLLPTSKSRPL